MDRRLGEQQCCSSTILFFKTTAFYRTKFEAGVRLDEQQRGGNSGAQSLADRRPYVRIEVEFVGGRDVRSGAELPPGLWDFKEQSRAAMELMEEAFELYEFQAHKNGRKQLQRMLHDAIRLCEVGTTPEHDEELTKLVHMVGNWNSVRIAEDDGEVA